MLKALAQAELAKAIALLPSAVVSVTANGKTAQGLRNSKTSEPSLTENGEQGLTTSKVFCNADTIGEIDKGQAGTVDGVAVTFLTCKVDSCGAIASIEYQEQQPIIGTGNVI
jgi:hypothetical protein